ncbi:MAG: RNA polymerase sigma factor [Planctomycetota bacterium]
MREEPSDPGVRLMLAYQRGDERAFDRLVEAYSGRIYALLTRFLGPVEGREDLVQEVFLRVIRARDRYTPEARLSTWLYRIAFNLCANERQRGRDREISLDAGRGEEGTAAQEWVDETAAAPSAGLERADVVHAVRRAIAALPPSQRMALLLAKYEELPYAEVAKALDSTEKAIKSMIHRARESLRESLAPFLREEVA